MAAPVFVGRENFEREVLHADVPVMVDFFTPSCLECRRLEPVVHQLANVFHDSVKVAFLNVAEAPEIASTYQVMSSPTLMFFKNGKPVDTLIGYQDSEHLSTHLQQVLQA
jgi:thioredoxin 1